MELCLLSLICVEQESAAEDGISRDHDSVVGKIAAFVHNALFHLLGNQLVRLQVPCYRCNLTT